MNTYSKTDLLSCLALEIGCKYSLTLILIHKGWWMFAMQFSSQRQTPMQQLENERCVQNKPRGLILP